ncbi:uncharacterized protein LOC126718073 isoform X6 [Quercus robur]|uniref:uncharacterized protein LOC126718073 isoform X6 n=1 Tax=Quercus robur TaxID=38942 RepID=UPI002162D89F|nr:uncharacterized protein LOC126718073 isoform X6 [Quercus robur]
MVERFFLASQMEQPNSHNQSDPDPDPIMLLSGPPSCGKSSLLFQFAFNSALDGNRNVVFICNRRKLESNPPFLSQGINPSSDTFQSIQMKYVDDDEGIKNYFAAFHLHDTFPAAVVVDDFGDFFEDSKTMPCKLLLSDTHHGDSPRWWLRIIYSEKQQQFRQWQLSEDQNCKVLHSFAVSDFGGDNRRQ